MPTLEQVARDYAAAHPRRVDDVTGAVTTWNLWCASLMHRFTGALRGYNSATLAGNAAAIVSRDPNLSEIGCLHYWHDPKNPANAGHVMIDVRGRGRLAFTTGLKSTEYLGPRENAIGFVPVTQYPTTLTYRGWARTYGANKNALVADDLWSFGTGGGGGGSGNQGDDMRLIRHPNGTITSVDGTTYQHHSLETYLADSAVWGPYTQLDEVTFNRVISNTQVRLAYENASRTGTSGSAVDVAAIAAKVEQNLADDFQRLADQIATVNANIDDQPTEFKITPA